MSSLTEANVQSMLQSIYTVTGQINTMVLVCGPELKRKFTEFTRFATGSDSAQELSIRTFTQPTEARKITAKVDTFEGDFGTISLLPSLFNAKDQNEATQLRRGYLTRPEHDRVALWPSPTFPRAGRPGRWTSRSHRRHLRARLLESEVPR
jgi:hypothetical protein